MFPFDSVAHFLAHFFLRVAGNRRIRSLCVSVQWYVTITLILYLLVRRCVESNHRSFLGKISTFATFRTKINNNDKMKSHVNWL